MNYKCPAGHIFTISNINMYKEEMLYCSCGEKLVKVEDITKCDCKERAKMIQTNMGVCALEALNKVFGEVISSYYSIQSAIEMNGLYDTTFFDGKDKFTMLLTKKELQQYCKVLKIDINDLNYREHKNIIHATDCPCSKCSGGEVIYHSPICQYANVLIV